MASLFTTGFALFIRARMQVSALKRALHKADRAQKNIEGALAKGDLSKLIKEFLAKMNAVEDAIGHYETIVHDANLVAWNKINRDVDMSMFWAKLEDAGLKGKEYESLAAANERAIAKLRQAMRSVVNEVQRIETAAGKDVATEKLSEWLQKVA